MTTRRPGISVVYPSRLIFGSQWIAPNFVYRLSMMGLDFLTSRDPNDGLRLMSWRGIERCDVRCSARWREWDDCDMPRKAF
jgi:hypothetical protein